MTDICLTERSQALRGWLAGLPDLHGVDVSKIEPASSDASFRRYFRIRSESVSYVVMDAPPDQEDCRPFVDVAAKLVEAGVRAPLVIAQDLQQGFLLLGDLGTRTYLQAVQGGTDPDHLYVAAIDTLVTIQTRVSKAGLPPYDERLLMQEMNLFSEWLLEKFLGLRCDRSMRKKLDDAFALLCDSALAEQTVFVHRDYHSRNLMYDGGAPGVLDFQDAVCGPLSYDLVSLLKDCYLCWPAERVRAWLGDYVNRARAAGLQLPDDQRFVSNFELMGVQRHLKASGIFARLWLRDGKRGYLDDIPNTLNHIVALSRPEPEIQFLQELISDQMLPGLKRANA